MSRFPGSRPLRSLTVRRASLSQVTAALFSSSQSLDWGGEGWEQQGTAGEGRGAETHHAARRRTRSGFPPSQLSTCVEFHLFNQTETNCSVKVLVP